jgi:hypothetical protein
MAVSAINPATGLFDPYTRDKEQIGTVLKLALFGKAGFPKGTSLSSSTPGTAAAADITAIKKQVRTAQVMCARLMGRRGVDFKGVFDTSDGSALASAFSLTTLGVTFPAATLRTISLFMVSSNDVETIYQEIEQDVWGNNGTTPKLGDARIKEAYKVLSGTYQKMGRIHMKTDAAGTEATDGTSNAGTAVAGLTNGTGVLTTPLHRMARVLGCNYAADTYNAATGCVPHVAALVGSTGAGRIDVAAADDGLADTTPGTGALDIELELWPQAQVQLVLNANAVEVHLRTTVADIYRHRIECYAGPAISNALSA